VGGGGDVRGGVSVGGDRAVGGGVTLKKEEKQTWKKRTKKQGPCGNKKIKPLKKFNTTFSWKIAGVTSGGQNLKGSKHQKRKRKRNKGKKTNNHNGNNDNNNSEGQERKEQDV